MNLILAGFPSLILSLVQHTFRCLLQIFSSLLWKGWELLIPLCILISCQKPQKEKIDCPNPWAVLTSESLCSWGVYSKCEHTLFAEQRWEPVNPFLSCLMTIFLQLQPPVRCKYIQNLLKTSERCPSTSASDIYWYRNQGWQAEKPV